MKMRITLSQKPSILTAISGEVVLQQSSESKYIVTYNMTEGCSTTDKFISLYKENIKKLPNCIYNIYKQNAPDTFVKLKVKTNSIIQKINTEIDEIPNVDESLMLDPASLDVESAKLNALHLYFEDESNKIIESNKLSISELEEFRLLENINQLVHSVERGVMDWIDFFCILRISPNDMTPVPTIPMTDEDYENFSINPTWGDLALDYFRVGKDLGHCYNTNDLELIKIRGLAQQNTIHTCFHMIFNDWRKDMELWNYERSFRWWIVKNNIKDYYDTDLPMYNLGKIVLGKIDMTGTSEEEVQNELDKCTAITNVELI